MRDQGVSATSIGSLSNNNLFENSLHSSNVNRQLSQPTINVSSYTSPSHKPSYVTPNYFNNFLNPNSLQKSLSMLQASMSHDFTSLPPGVNMTQTTSQHNQHSMSNEARTTGGSGNAFGLGNVEINGDYQDGLLNVNEYNNYNRRFSDPGLPGLTENGDVVPPADMKDDKVNNSQAAESTKIFKTLLEQINLLHETNTKIFRNLHENKGNYCCDIL